MKIDFFFLKEALICNNKTILLNLLKYFINLIETIWKIRNYPLKMV